MAALIPTRTDATAFCNLQSGRRTRGKPENTHGIIFEIAFYCRPNLTGGPEKLLNLILDFQRCDYDCLSERGHT